MAVATHLGANLRLNVVNENEPTQLDRFMTLRNIRPNINAFDVLSLMNGVSAVCMREMENANLVVTTRLEGAE